MNETNNQIVKEKPFRNVGVGNLYLCFAKDIDNLDYEEIIYKLPTLKSIGTTENSNAEEAWASNAVYDVDTSTSGIELSVSVIAFSPLHRARMKGHKVKKGFIVKNTNDEGEYFAFGVVYPKKSGHYTYEWYPKCKLSEATKDAQTKDKDGINSQDKSLTINAAIFNDAGDYGVEYDTELLEDRDVALTEEQFFSIVRTAYPANIETVGE